MIESPYQPSVIEFLLIKIASKIDDNPYIYVILLISSVYLQHMLRRVQRSSSFIFNYFKYNFACGSHHGSSLKPTDTLVVYLLFS